MTTSVVLLLDIFLSNFDGICSNLHCTSRSICISCPGQVPKLITFLNPLLNSSVDVHRIVSVSLFVEFLSQNYRGRKTLTEPLMNSLLGRLVDSSPIVRRLCISGLGNISMLDKEQVFYFGMHYLVYFCLFLDILMNCL